MCAVVEEDARGTRTPRFEQLVETDLDVAETNASVELEPVDPRSHHRARRPRRPIRAPFGVYLPAGAQPGRDQRTELVGWNDQTTLLRLVIPLALDAERRKLSARRGFGVEVPVVHGASAGVVQGWRRFVARDVDRAIVETGDETPDLAIPLVGRRDFQRWNRRGVDFGDRASVRKVDRRNGRQRVEAREEFRKLLAVDVELSSISK